jgi:hypothetical protein
LWGKKRENWTREGRKRARERMENEIGESKEDVSGREEKDGEHKEEVNGNTVLAFDFVKT